MKLRKLLLWFLFIDLTISTAYRYVNQTLQEVAYGYYMRGKYIQYNSNKAGYFSPEEATSQNIKFFVCSEFVSAVYKELLNISIPLYSGNLNTYAKEHLNCPEIIAYPREIKDGYELVFKKSNGDKVISSIMEVISYLKVGDILTYYGKGGGHTVIIYDIISQTEAIIIEAGTGDGEDYVNTKINHTNHYLYLYEKINPDFNGKIAEGSVGMRYLSKVDLWANLKKALNYSIIRFINEDNNHNAILNYNYPINSEDGPKNGNIITLSQKNLARIKFKHLFIEKTVDKINNNVVEKGEILTYKIRVKNEWENDYLYNLFILEYLDENVDFINTDYSESDVIIFNEIEKEHRLRWYIKKLKKDEEVIVEYSVKIRQEGDFNTIVSTGKVGGQVNSLNYYINSATIKNTIGKNLDINQEKHLIDIYNDLKSENYKGTEFINKIYSEAFGTDLKINYYNIKYFVKNININSIEESSLKLSETHPFYKMVLNNYWSCLAKNENNNYDLKNWREPGNPLRRRDFIYRETFKTGDILLYTSNDDSTTYENGEYAYIYINNTFVGKNYGNDGKSGTKDDRNEFNPEYYTKNKLSLFNNNKFNKFIEDKDILEIGNYQTLFGKDYYVILRPSLNNNFSIKCQIGKYLKNNVCEKCPTGFYSLEDGSSCRKCPKGQYLKNNKCYSCQAGTFCVSGALKCTTCPAGTYSAPGSGTCKKCPSGYYSKAKSSFCTKCPNGFYSVKDGSSCRKCPNGQYLKNNKCYSCQAGTFCVSGALKCTPCPAGTYSAPGSGTCKKCPSGYYSKVKSSFCTICPAGYFSKNGANKCTICPGGTYSYKGSAACVFCKGGYYSNKGAKSCNKCKAGTYSSPGSMSCKKCPKGKSSKAGSSFCK